MLTNEVVSARCRVDEYFHAHVWRRFGVDLFAGVTTLDERQGRIAVFIVERALQDRPINPKARRGVPRETWGQVFERGYHVRLSL